MAFASEKAETIMATNSNPGSMRAAYGMIGRACHRGVTLRF